MQVLAAAATAGGLWGQTGGTKLLAGQIGTRHAHADGQLLALREGKDFELVGVVVEDDAAWEAARKREAYQGLKRLSLGALLAVPGASARCLLLASMPTSAPMDSAPERALPCT